MSSTVPFRAGLATFIAGCALVVSCTSAPQKAAAITTYPGVLEVYLEPNDAHGVCSVTIGLRNLSGTRQGEGRLQIAWFDRGGSLLADQSLRMDATDIDQYDAKNMVLPVTCDRAWRVKIRSAQWSLGWDATAITFVPIDGVDGTERPLRWDDQVGLFVGQP